MFAPEFWNDREGAETEAPGLVVGRVRVPAVVARSQHDEQG